MNSSMTSVPATPSEEIAQTSSAEVEISARNEQTDATSVAEAASVAEEGAPPFVVTNPCGVLDALDGLRWSDVEVAKKALRDEAVLQGFAVALLRTVTYEHTENPRRFDFECTHGKRKEMKGKKVKNKSRRFGCRFLCNLSLDKRRGEWRLVRKVDTHNDHNRDVLPGSLAVMRKHERRHHAELVSAAVQRYMTSSSVPATAVAREVQLSVGCHVDGQDIRNLAAESRREALGVLTDTQTFVDALRNDESTSHRIKLQDGDTGAVQHVIWMRRWSIEQLRRNYEVLIIDNTYKTNAFGRPLMQIAGVTSAHTSFVVATAIMLGETEESYRWVLAGLIEMMEENEVQKPFVIVTDKEEACRNAIRSLFPSDQTAKQLCLWHVQKNVAFNIKKKWTGSLEGTRLGQAMGSVGSRTTEDREERAAGRMAESLLEERDRSTRAGGANIRNIASSSLAGVPPSGRRFMNSADGILAAWKACVYASTEEGFMEGWEVLKDEFSGQSSIINYLEVTYMDVREEFAEYGTRQHRNYGVRVTSRVEALHQELKKEIKSCNGSLLTLYQAIGRYLDQKEERFERAYHNDIAFESIVYRRRLYRLLLRNVSNKALDLIHAEEEKAKAVIEREGGEREGGEREGGERACTGLFSHQYGLPCSHKLEQIMRANGQIEMTDIHPHWWNERTLPSEEDMRRRRIQDPVMPERPQDRSRRHDLGTTRVRTGLSGRRRGGGGGGGRGGSRATQTSDQHSRQVAGFGQDRELRTGAPSLNRPETQPNMGVSDSSQWVSIAPLAQTQRPGVSVDLPPPSQFFPPPFPSPSQQQHWMSLPPPPSPYMPPPSQYMAPPSQSQSFIPPSQSVFPLPPLSQFSVPWPSQPTQAAFPPSPLAPATNPGPIDMARPSQSQGRRAPSRCSACGGEGHNRSNRSCPRFGLNS